MESRRSREEVRNQQTGNGVQAFAIVRKNFILDRRRPIRMCCEIFLPSALVVFCVLPSTLNSTVPDLRRIPGMQGDAFEQHIPESLLQS